MDALAGAGDDAHIVGAFLIRLSQDPDLFPLLSLDDGDGLGQDLPDHRLVHMPHFQGPEAQVMVAPDRAALVGRMVEGIRRQERIRGGQVHFLPVQVLPVQVFLLHFGKNTEGEQRKDQEERNEAFNKH